MGRTTKKNKEFVSQGETITQHFRTTKKRSTSNRFGGLTEDDLAKRGLRDLLKDDLDLVFVGINPGFAAAHTGRYYSNPTNHFWRALYMSGLIPAPLSSQDDEKLLDLGIGLTDICPRVTQKAKDLSTAEIREGAAKLREKMGRHRPKVVVFMGKKIYEIYSGEKNFVFGRQRTPMFEPSEGREATHIWVMPSTSSRCAQIPRAVDKVPFFAALKTFLAYLKGEAPEPEECEVTFASVVLGNVHKKIKVEVEDRGEEENG